jgi:hypothetical protein
MNIDQGKIDISILACIAMGGIYLFFPSTNNTLDSLAFATSVRDGNNLFFNHHLLYNPLAYILTRISGISNTISFMCFMNAMFAMGCLFLMRSMLLHFTDKKTATVLILFLGSCFGFIRFATDAEAYIIPLFIALWGIRRMLLKQHVFTVSLLLSTACLFHQMYFFWWLGLYILIFLFFNKDRVRNFFLYASAACIVPAIYLAVFCITENDCNSIIEFVFHDYIKYDSVDISFKPVTLILTPISFFRTFAQVHGYFLPLLQKYSWLCIPILISFVLFFAGCVYLKDFVKKRNNTSEFNKKFAQAHLIVFILQFLFAAFSDGNAEFMYMLPFTGILYVIINYRIRLRAAFYFTLALFLWNFSLGIYPHRFIELNSDKSMAKYMSENSREIYYLQNGNSINNIMKYYYPCLKVQFYPAEKKVNLDSLISVNESIITNITGNKTFLSRTTFVYGSDKKLENKYRIEKVDSITYELGVLNITRLSQKP